MNRQEMDFMLTHQVQDEKGCNQNKFHEFDVYDHTIVFIDEVKKLVTDPEVIIASWLHDIGKPVVAKPLEKDGRVQYNEQGQKYQTFPDHEKAGEEMVRQMSAELFIKHNLNQERIAKLVGNHFLPMKGIKKMRLTENLEEFLNAFSSLEQTLDQAGDKAAVLTMFVADTAAKGKGADDVQELMMIRQALLCNGQQRQIILLAVYKLQKELADGGKRYSQKA